MTCPLNTGSPKHLVGGAEAKTHRLALAAQISSQVHTNTLDFSKSKNHLFATTVLGYGDFTIEGFCYGKRVLLCQLDPKYHKGRKKGT